MINLISVFTLCVILAGVIIPKILLISFRKRLFDTVDERKIHQGAVPRLGGLAFSPVVVFSIALVLGINIILGWADLILHIDEVHVELLFGVCSLLMLYVVGMADDLIGVRYSAKFIVQILCGLLLVTSGVYIDNLHGLLGIHELPLWMGYALTILVVVFFTNAINLIDGVDGLASGLSIVALLIYAFAFLCLTYRIYSAVALAFLGVVMPFFYYNVFGNADKGKKIFMGDTGSLTLGFVLSFLSIRLFSSIDYSTPGHCNPFILAFAPMFIPCFDVLRVFARRIRNHQSPFLPDRIHIHHKLLALGLNSKVTMTTLVSVSILATALNIELSRFVNVNLLFLANLLLWIGVNMLITRKIRQKNPDTDFK